MVSDPHYWHHPSGQSSWLGYYFHQLLLYWELDYYYSQPWSSLPGDHDSISAQAPIILAVSLTPASCAWTMLDEYCWHWYPLHSLVSGASFPPRPSSVAEASDTANFDTSATSLNFAFARACCSVYHRWKRDCFAAAAATATAHCCSIGWY